MNAAPGVVWSPRWRPEPDDPVDVVDNPQLAVGLRGAGRKP